MRPLARLQLALPILIAALPLSRPAAAGLQTWTTSGPDGGVVNHVAGTGSTVLAGTNLGIYRSTDGGLSWSAPSLVGVIQDVVFDPFLSSYAYASQAGTIYRTTDAGATWDPSASGLTGNVLSISVVNGSLYAGTESNGLFSSSQADSWTKVTSLPALGSISRVVEDANGHLYVGGAGGPSGGVYKSTDGGGTWTQKKTGLADSGGNALTVVDLAADPADTAGVVWAAVQGYAPGLVLSNVRRTTDGGATWAAANTGLPSRFARNVFYPSGGPLYATLELPAGGLFRSTDAGVHWTEIDASLQNKRVLDVAFVGSVRWVATDGGGVFRTGDDTTYTPMNNGLRALVISTVRSAAVNTPYAATDAGCWRGSGDPITWTALNGGLVDSFGSTPKVYDTMAYPGEAIYLGTSDGFFVSHNLGTTFTPSNTGILDGDNHPVAVKRLDFDPGSLQNLYAITGLGFARSGDSGATWSVTSTSPVIPGQLSCLAAGGNEHVYLGTQVGVLLSTNGGASFSPKNTGLTTTFVTGIQVEPDVESHAIVSTSGGLYQTTDAGDHWAALNTLATSATDVAMAPSRHKTVYTARGFPRNVYFSTNGGTALTTKNDGLESAFALGLGPGSISADREISTQAYVGVNGSGVYAITLTPSGDPSGDGKVNVGDVFYLINALFAGGPPPAGTGDANGDGVTNVGDVFYLIGYLFAGGPAPR